MSTANSVLLWLCALKIAALILVLDPAGVVAFQLPKALASRVFEWPIAAALLIAFARDGRAILPRHRLNWLVFAWVAVSALSAVFAVDRFVAIFGDAENYAGLTFVLDMALLYLATAVAVRGERDVLVLLGAVLVAGAIAIAYGAAQSLGLDPFNWAADPRARPFSTFGNADHFGHFLSVFFAVTLGLGIAASNTRTRAIGAIGGALALAMAAIVATRATLLGIGGSLAAALSLRPTARAIVIAIVVVAGGGLALAFTPLGQRVIAGGTANDRLPLWDAAVRATFARPILGYGVDNFRAAFPAHRTVESLASNGPGPQSTAHDWVLDASATTGVVGLVALFAVVALGTLELWRLARTRPSIGAPLLLGWVAYWADALVAAASLAAAWYPWLALGVAAALRGARGERRTTRVIPRWAIASVYVVAVVAASTGLRAFQANRDAWTSEEATQQGDLETAITFADRAAARDGGRADNWNRLGLAFEAASRRADSVEAYREATQRQPYEAVYWTNLARAIARTAGADASRRDESLDAARQATIVDPNAPIGHVALAEIATAFGRCDLARTEAARAAALERGHEELMQRAQSCR